MIVDLTERFDDLDPAALAVDRDDFHPNARGHARLAQRLDQAMQSNARNEPRLGNEISGQADRTRQVPRSREHEPAR